jgi:hypothetical protein
MQSKIYSRWGFNYSTKIKAFLNLSLTNGTYTLNVYELDLSSITDPTTIDQENYTLLGTSQFKEDQLAIDKKLMGIFKNRLTDVIDLESITESRDSLNILQLQDLDYSKLLLTIYRLGDKYCIISDIPLQTDLSVTLLTSPTTSSDILSGFFGTDFTNIQNLKKARVRVIVGADPNDSLAYMEAQLDILSQLVFAIYDLLPDTSKNKVVGLIPELFIYREKLESSYVMTVKPSDKCLQELDTKAKIRNLQSQYYMAKNNFES